MRLHSYSNEEHKLSSGVCCDEFSLSRCDNSCDNLFNFCLRSAGQVPDTSLSNCSLGLISLTFFYPDLVDFHQDSVLPFFSREAWSVSLLSHSQIIDITVHYQIHVTSLTYRDQNNCTFEYETMTGAFLYHKLLITFLSQSTQYSLGNQVDQKRSMEYLDIANLK